MNPPTQLHSIDHTARELRHLRRVARLLDGRFGIPFTRIRFGFDSLLGLLPVGGDVATGLVGLYIVYRARQMGVRNEVIGRMLVNVGLDTMAGFVPVAGDVADLFFKSNLRNIRLLEEEMGERERHEARGSRH